MDEAHLLTVLASLHRCEAVTGEMLARAPIEVVRLLPANHAIRLNAVPYALQKARVKVAFVNPGDLAAVDEVSALTGRLCVPGVVTELRLMQAHRRFYGRTIPVEFRPAGVRTEGTRPEGRSREAVPVTRATSPAAPASEDEAVEPITIPDLPIPNAPAAAAPAKAPAESASAPPGEPSGRPPRPDAEDAPGEMWMSTPRDRPHGEEISGMWSPSPAEGDATSRPAVFTDSRGDLAVQCFPADLPRVLLLANREGALVGWRARGVEEDRLAGVRVPPDPLTIFSSIDRTDVPHFGLLAEELWPEPLSRLFGAPPPCAVFPIHASGGIAAFLYADRRGAPLRSEDFAELARAAASIASLFGPLASLSVPVPS